MKTKTKRPAKGQHQIPDPEALHHEGAENEGAAVVSDGKGGSVEVYENSAAAMMEVRLTGGLSGCCRAGICGSPNADNEHAAGDLVKLPRAFVQAKPWLSEFGQEFDLDYIQKVQRIGTADDPFKRLK